MDAPSDDRTCAQRGEDAITQAVDWVGQQLSHYRATGQFAVMFGWPVLRRKILAQVASALGQTPAPPIDEPRIAWPTRDDTESTRAPLDAGIPGAAPRDAPPLGEFARESSPPDRTLASGTSNTPGSAPASGKANGARSAEHLPIPGYDSLSASQVVERLAGLHDEDLDEVRGYESAHRNRRTILGKIDQLRASS